MRRAKAKATKPQGMFGKQKCRCSTGRGRAGSKQRTLVRERFAYSEGSPVWGAGRRADGDGGAEGRALPAEHRVRDLPAQLCLFDGSPTPTPCPSFQSVPSWNTTGPSVSYGIAAVCAGRVGAGPALQQGMRPSVSGSDETLPLPLERGG